MTIGRTIFNFIEFYDLAPYPLRYSASKWYKLPEWQRAQLEHDDYNVRLNRNYTIVEEDLKSKTITFRFDFKQSNLLVNTPSTWILPNSRFDIYSDLYQLVHIVGESSALFKFINETNKHKPSLKAFKNSDLSKFENYQIGMDLSLVKTSKTTFDNKTFSLKTEEGQVLNLPAIFEVYSYFILQRSNRELGINSSKFYQNIYFPIMLKLGYADYDKYETYNNKFDKENNPGWSYLTIKVSYIKNPIWDPQIEREINI